MRGPSRRVRVALGVLFALLLGLFLLARPFLFHKHYDVVSIRAAPEYQDAALLSRAWELPVAAEYRRAGLLYQTNGSICGPTSLADVMRTLGFSQETAPAVLDGTGHCRTGVCFGGLTLDDLAQIARDKTHRRVTVMRDLSLSAFRDELAAHANDPARRYTINFDRGPLFGTAGGHHSPIGGYLADRDLVFVLDVNEHYRPWLVRTERLFAAMDTVDDSSGKKRGLLRFE